MFSYQFLQVINVYAYTANIENDKIAFNSTLQSQELSSQHGEFDPKKERSWIESVGKICLKGRTQCRAPALCGVWGRVSVASLTLAYAMRGDRDLNPGPSGHRR
jgi:hypothetical protein